MESFLDRLDRWVQAHRGSLARCGAVTYGHSSQDGRDKGSAWLQVQCRDGVVELLLWDTGEAELGWGSSPGNNVDEHHEVVTVGELHHLLARFTRQVHRLGARV